MRPAALLLAVSSLSVPARAQDVPRDRGVEVSWAVDGAITGATGVAWITSELLKSHLAPSTCRWCSVNLLDGTITGVAAWKDIGTASRVGDVTGFAVVPLVTGGLLTLASSRAGHLREMPENGLLMLEAVTVSAALNQVVKFAVGRERPFVADLPASEKGSTRQPADNNLSFYSGHSNLAFALAFSAGTLAHLRGYEGEPYVWAVGVPLAAFVAYSRVAARKHYFTDVLLGSATGAAFGVLVPLLHRPKASTGSARPAMTVSPTPSGLVLAGTW